ncbi:MAG: hypothetical protein L0Y44_11080, partial [Phycisphaerales bacterium]|nr:hypothetical protein [Phycisphaerales bacterium]MCI0631182.1 hypothetical protein [Phycisphaerales bacterium]
MSTMTTMRPPAVRTSSAQVRGAKHSFTSTIDPMRVLRRHALGIALSAVGGAVVGVGAYFLLDQFLPLYSGEVLFEVQPGLRQAGQISSDDFGDDATVYRLAQTETYLLTSRDVLGAALTNPEIKQTRWHQKFQQTNSEGRTVFNNAEALDELEEDLSTSVFRNSNLFSLRWSAPEPRDVPILLGAISEAYIKNRKARDEAV